MTFVLRTSGVPTALVGSARAAVASVDAGLPLASVRPMTEVVDDTANQPRFTAIVMTFFELLVIFLQAYVFTVLMGTYLNGSIEAEH